MLRTRSHATRDRGDRLSPLQILEKNRRIAYKHGWRRLWDGRGGALFEKWVEGEVKKASAAVTATLQDSDDEAKPVRVRRLSLHRNRFQHHAPAA